MPIIKSAYANSLNTSAPRPIDEYLEHFLCALLQTSYNLALSKDGEDNLRLALNLPRLDKEDFLEGVIQIPEELKDIDAKEHGLNEVMADMFPSKMLENTSEGPLKALYEYVTSRREELKGEAFSNQFLALKHASGAVLKAAMQQISEAAKGMESRSIFDIDPALAKAELGMIEALRDNSEIAACEDLKVYFNKIAELHSELEAEVIIDENAEQEHGHEHHGCCGGH